MKKDRALITENDNRKRINVIAAFLLFAFLLLAYRTEHSANQIKSNTEKIKQTVQNVKQADIANCELANSNSTAFNKLLDLSIAATEANPDVPEAKKKEARRILTNSKLRLAICDPPPAKKP